MKISKRKRLEPRYGENGVYILFWLYRYRLDICLVDGIACIILGLFHRHYYLLELSTLWFEIGEKINDNLAVKQTIVR